MKPLVGKVLLFLFFLLISAVAIPQEIDWVDIPVTTNSPEALELYKAGISAMYEIKLKKANDYCKKANELDSNFVMPNIWFATRGFYFNNMTQFREYATKALKSTYTLNESEIILQKALKALLEDPDSNVTMYGEELVELNPKSILAHQTLANFQKFAKDLEGVNKTYQTMLQLTKNPAPIYNALGYNYMALGKINEALDAFDKYIEAEPKNPNSYDSMGDYYFKVEDYQRARVYFMKAYTMDTVNFKFSYAKAVKIKPK